MKLFEILKKILYIILCILIIIYISSNMFIVCFIAQHILKHIDFQVLFYFLFSIILILTIILGIFIKKITLRQKIFLTIGCIILFIIFEKLPSVDKTFKIKHCYKTGICAQGLKATTKDNINFVINKENCEKYNYEWNSLKKTCDLRSDKLNKSKQNVK